MWTRWWTVGIWAAVVASASYWGWRTVAPASPHADTAPSKAVAIEVTPEDWGRLLGKAPPKVVAAVESPRADARFHLTGVISPDPGHARREGFALIAVDGKPPGLFHVGAVVEGEDVLQAVEGRSIRLGPRDGAARVTLSLAPPAPAARGVLPSLSTAVQEAPRPTAQELFQERQRLQFEQEERQNRAGASTAE